jgi:hypothetical protein
LSGLAQNRQGLFDFAYLKDYGSAGGIFARVGAVDVGPGFIVFAIKAPLRRFRDTQCVDDRRQRTENRNQKCLLV